MSAEANFLFEMWMLAKQDRTWFAFLWTWKQSIAEHVNRVCYTGYVLAQMDGTVDPAKVVMMCLFHDMAEARSLDHHYTAQAYVTVDEARIVEDQTKNLSFWQDIKNIVHEYEQRQSQESLLAKDADYIELFLLLKEQADLWNPNGKKRMWLYLSRMRTEAWKKLMQEITETWYDDRRIWPALWTMDKKDAKHN